MLWQLWGVDRFPCSRATDIYAIYIYIITCVGSCGAWTGFPARARRRSTCSERATSTTPTASSRRYKCIILRSRRANRDLLYYCIQHVFREGDFDYPYRLKQARAKHIMI